MMRSLCLLLLFSASLAIPIKVGTQSQYNCYLEATLGSTTHTGSCDGNWCISPALSKDESWTIKYRDGYSEERIAFGTGVCGNSPNWCWPAFHPESVSESPVTLGGVAGYRAKWEKGVHDQKLVDGCYCQESSYRTFVSEHFCPYTCK